MAATTSPYWGNLDPPTLSAQNSNRRNSMDDKGNARYSSQYPVQQQLPQRRSTTTSATRTSTQSQAPTVSTQSPFASPIRSSFQADGLAPRPPSFAYGAAEGYNKDYLDKRRRRASREAEGYYKDSENTVPPPAAPDAPRPAPPSSLKQPYYNSQSTATYQAPVRSRSTRQSAGPVDALQSVPAESYRESRKDSIISRPGRDREQPNTNIESRRQRNSVPGDSDGRRDYPDKGVIRRGTVDARRERPEYHDSAAPSRTRKGSAADIEAQRRREWAPDRSPLQRLELTLDSITKEEKRARVEEAELLAREAKAGRGGERINQNSVRFRNRPVVKTAEPVEQTEPQSLPEAGLVRNLSNKQKDELQRSGTVERKKPADTGSAPTKQLGTGFEYKPQTPPKINISSRDPEKSSVPQRGQSLRERAVVPSAGAAIVAAGLSRSASNKLKKEPPGDPWYSRRQEVEKAYPEVTQRRSSVEASRAPNTITGGPLGSAPVALTARKLHPDLRDDALKRQDPSPPTKNLALGSQTDTLYPAPVSRYPSKKIEQLTGQIPNARTMKSISPQQQQLYADRLDRSEELGPETGQQHDKSQTEVKTVNGKRYAVSPEVGTGKYGQEQAARGVDGHHHFADINPLHHHHRRSQYQPGDGLYVAERPLDEWKKAGVAVLTGSLLDLESTQTEAEKDKAWWETNNTGRRRPSTTRQRKIETYDGEPENINGMVFLDFSNSIEDNDRSFLFPSAARTWSQVIDPIVPRARTHTGFKKTPYTETLICDGPKWGSRGKRLSLARLERNGQALSPQTKTISTLFSTYSYDCPKVSKHNVFHPFHICPQPFQTVRKRLTPTMRLIRVCNIASTKFNPPLYLKCGPLLRYCGLRRQTSASRPGHGNTAPAHEFWRGSVMIVTTDAESNYDIAPTIRLFAQPIDLLPPPPAHVDGGADELAPEYVDPIAGLPKIGRDGRTLYVRPVEELDEEKDFSKDESENGLFENRPSTLSAHRAGHDGTTEAKPRTQKTKLDGERLGKYIEVRGFRLNIEHGVTFWRFNIEIELQDQQQRIAYRINRGPVTGFWVPARGQSMNIMFHSCNGFSLSVNPDQFSGPDPMWRDVLNTHQTQPFHVMIGGGDQIYNDSVMKNTTLFSQWLSIKNPLEKHNAPFTSEMQQELDTFFLNRYSTWFSQGLFGLANSQIAMVNIFDDHDIIDGFGSYPHTFMDTPVFSGLGAIAFKYYMLFQHQSVIEEGEETEPSWLLGTRPGPYIRELSRSVFMHLGSNIAFLGLDCRTERTQQTVLTDDTCLKIFDKMHDEIVKGETKHLLVLLGIPIAYPRLVWLENILTSRLMDPIKAVGKAPMFGNFLNKFDGGVEVLDDLNDHWTAKNHKLERKDLIEDLQDLAAAKSIRITILSGDVHLAAIGQFYSNPKLGIPKDRDFRYMPNIISSAIVNTPPPSAMADIVNRRNKVHHLDDDTDESMIPLFDTDVTGAKRNNKRLLPRRNWCSIREYNPDMTPPPTPPDERSPSPPPRGGLLRRFSSSRGPSYRPDVGPPPSRGLMRNISIRGRNSTDSERPGIRQRALSLSARDFTPGNIFRRLSTSRNRHEDGGINGYSSDEEDQPDEQLRPPKLRGGGGDDSYFPPDASHPPTRKRVGRDAVIRGHDDEYESYDESPEQHKHVHHQQAVAPEPLRRPFHRTPTGMSEKQRKKLGASHEVNIEGGLDICLNVEVSQKDPAGITIPYRLLVPPLWYENTGESYEDHKESEKKVTGLSRLMSLGRRKAEKTAWKGKAREDMDYDPEDEGR